MRDAALKRVAILDCARREWDDEALSPCNPSAPPPEVVSRWKEEIKTAAVKKLDDYAKALSRILGDLVCADKPDRIDVLRGLELFNRFEQTGLEMPALAKRITSKECPVSNVLTDDDRRHIAKTVADNLETFICSNEPDRIDVLRRLLRDRSFLQAGGKISS